MQSVGKYKNCIEWIVAIVVCTLFVCGCVFLHKSRMSDGYDLVILGDSIMGRERVDTPVDAVMQKELGISVYNGAFGGSDAVSYNPIGDASYHEDSLNLCRLAKAISEKDFGVQLADIPNNKYKLDFFDEVLDQLSRVDFEQVDYLIIEQGTNDYSVARPLDNAENPYDIESYGGALRYSIEKLRAAYPHMQLFLVTPAFCRINDVEDCDKLDFGGGTMDVYADKMREIGKEYGLVVIDVYKDGPINRENVREMTVDLIHLNQEGREAYGQFIAEQMKPYIK